MRRLASELFVVPDFPTEADSDALMNPENFVVLTVVPLPSDQLAFTVRKPLALSADTCVVSNIGVTFVDNLISIGIDFDTANTHIKTVCRIAPKPSYSALIRTPRISARMPLPAVVIPV